METNLLLFLQIFFWHAHSHSPAYILNHHLQLVTSSSLQWVRSRDGNRPQQAVVGGRNGSKILYICRSVDLVGQLDAEGCSVVVGETVQTQHSHYEVLSNIDGSARLEWINWKQFSKLSHGAVSVKEDLFVAREEGLKDLDGKSVRSKAQFIGGLSLQDEYGLISLPPDGRKITSGQLLVEHEPVRYVIKSFRHGKVRHVESSDVTLEKTVELKSDWPNSMKSNTEGRIIHYSYNETLYFGKGHNIPTGGDVTLIFENGSNIDIRWGLAKELPVIHKLRMNYDIPPDSSVKVHIMATQIDRKLEYSATLVSLYHDGQTLERPIQGVYRQVVMEHLRPVYGFPIIRRNKTGSEDHYQALRNKIENSVKMEAIVNNGNDILTLGNEKDKLEKSLNQSRTTKIDFRFSEEVEPEWRMPRDNSNKISWVKPLMSSSSSTSTSFNVVLTTLFILTFCRFAQFLN